MSKLRPLNWSQRVTMRMIADGRSPSGGTSYLDPTGLSIPGGTLRSLRQRGLIERYAWFEPGWVLTKAGADAIRAGECEEPDEGEAEAPEKPHRLAPGRYLYRHRAIIRTDWQDGARGGTVFKWELGHHDPHAGIVLDGDYGYRTLAEAIRAIDAETTNDGNAP